MQDRFRFRFWDKETKTMQKSPKIELRQRITLDTIFDDDRVIFMQCTGLKDKNDKLIYEGDRVYIDCEDETAIIKWSDDLARFTIHFEDEAVFADFDNYYSKELKVIGNVYENSELPKE